jgi:hypothetical protein
VFNLSYSMFGTCLVLAFLAIIVIMFIMDEISPQKNIPHTSNNESKEDFNVVVNNGRGYGRRGYGYGGYGYGGYGGYGYGGYGGYGYPYYGYNSLWYPYGYNYDLYGGYDSPYYRPWYSWFNPYNWWY